jgi:hypothetical protein
MTFRPKWICVLTVFALIIGRGVHAEPRRLNNLVTELARGELHGRGDHASLTFMNPRHGWVFFSATTAEPAGVRLSDGRQETLLFQPDTAPDGPVESMRLLPAGDYTLVRRDDESNAPIPVLVRAIPEMHYCRYPTNPTIEPYGPYDWAFLERHVLPHVNTIVGMPKADADAHIDAWTRRGGKWIGYGHLPHGESTTVDEAVAYWTEHPGFADPRMSGLIADEFQGRQHPLYSVWTEALGRMGRNAALKGKAFYGYCGGPGMYSRPETREAVRTIFEAGYYMAWERYHHEMPTLDEAEVFMDGLLGKEMRKWQKTFPGCERQLVMVLGMFNSPHINTRPDVDYKTWMDMQMQYLAGRPEFDGLFGVHWWYSGAADEETIRWMGQLYRHYGIEGRTTLLSDRYGYRYTLRHIRNPDFFDGLEGWTAEAATPDSVTTGYKERYARLQGRYWHRTQTPDQPAGNTYLRLRRGDKPNRVSQTIMNLRPGEWYSVKMIVGDHHDIHNHVVDEKDLAVTLSVGGGEIDPVRSFKTRLRGSAVGAARGVTHPDYRPWLNFHRVVFRTTGQSGTLTISDWASATDPGGPAGQEFMINFIELQPYFTEPPSGK